MEVAEPMVGLWEQVESDIVKDIARRLAKNGKMTESAKWQAVKARELGMMDDEIASEVAKGSKASNKIVRGMVEDACAESLKVDIDQYRKAGLDASLLAGSDNIKKIIDAGAKQTAKLMRNFSGTTAKTASKAFENSLDRAWLQVESGAFSINQAMAGVIRDLAQKGINKIAYPSGHVDHSDVAVRRAMVTGINQTAAKVQLASALEMGCDIVEVTSHAGARPSHAEWQGQRYSISGKSKKYRKLNEATGYGTGEGLCGWNCRHNFFPYLEGVSEPTFERDPSTRLGKSNDVVYAESQQQRALERAVRASKRECAALDESIKAASDDGLKTELKGDFDGATLKLKKREKALDQFCIEHDREKYGDRARVFGYNKSVAGKTQQSFKSQAMAFWKQAAKNEPGITAKMQEVAKRNGMMMDGLEYRIKTAESFMRKVRKDGAFGDIKDVIRYTCTSGSGSLTEKTLKSLSDYESEGFKVVKVKNTWGSKKNPYRGVNTNIVSPDGQIFEMQFHTPESFALKNGEMHKLYEAQRQIKDEMSAEFIRLRDRMFELSDGLEVPKGIEKVVSR